MRGIILIDHGSRRDESNARILEVAAGVAVRCPDSIVEGAHMELAEPTLASAFDRAVSRGATEIVIHPYFLSPGRHVIEDIPRLCRDAAATHPGVPWRITEPTGGSPSIYDAILSSIEAAEKKPQ
jgi:sirohydrochlorin ferrochelatase